MEVHVSTNAIRIYMELIGAASETEARAALSGPAVAIAAKFGARVVKLPHARILLKFTPITVIVVSVHMIDGRLPLQLLPVERGGPPPIAQECPRFKSLAHLQPRLIEGAAQ